jgi:superfamily II DNA or RNA helicase
LTWRSRLPASIATWFSRDLVAPALALFEAGGVTLRAVDDARIVAVVRSNGAAPHVAIEWAGGTGPHGLRAVCGCGGTGVCAHVVAALEAVRSHVDADASAPDGRGSLDWLPPIRAVSPRRARRIWPVFFTSASALSCALFLDAPRLRGVVRDAQAIAAMLEQSPPDDWDEDDRRLVRDAILLEAFGQRANPRALAQIMFRLARHPRVRYDDRPESRRHPEELPAFSIDPRGVRLVASLRGARAIPGFETQDGRRLDLRSAVILEGPPAWIADARGAYVLDAALDTALAERAIAAAREADGAAATGEPSLETLARVAPLLSSRDRAAAGIREAQDPVGRLHLAWSDGALVVRPYLRDRSCGASAALAPGGMIAKTGGSLVRFSAEQSRAIADRLVAAGCVPAFEGTFAIHGAVAAAEFVRTALSAWSDLEIELDHTLGALASPRPLAFGLTARPAAGIEDWFELDVDVALDDGEPLSREELRALLGGSGRYAEVRGRLVDVGALRERAVLLDELLGRRKTGLAALLALRDELHEAFGRIRLPEHVEELRERVRRFEGIPRVEPPEPLRGVMRRYQERGLDFLSYLGAFRFGGVLADDLGIGKTLMALAYLLHRRERDGRAPSLVIAPTSVTHTWSSEITKFTPQLRALQLTSGNERAALYAEVEHYDVVVTSYALARIDAEKLAGIRFRAVILDEAQNAKNPASQISKVVRSLQAEHRLALTGTPVENSLRDLWAIFAFLEPGLLGTESSFRRRFEAPIHNGDRDAIAALHARLEPFILRRTKEDVAPELPERTETEIVVDLSPTQRKLYRAIAEAARREIVDVWDGVAPQKAGIHVLAALTRLRQVCAHPGLLAKRYLAEPESSAKFDALSETIDEIVAGGHKVLVFSAFASMLRVIRDDLARRGISCGYLDGSVKERDRRAEVAAFMAEAGPPVFLCSLKAGGVGLTLTAADYVVLYDPWWNPAVERQAIDRTHRIGQRHAVTAYRMLTRGTVEEKIRTLAGRKRELSDNVIRADAAMAKALTREDLEFLFSEPD